MVNLVVLLAFCLPPQEELKQETLGRGDKSRKYLGLIRTCQEAEKWIQKNPRRTIELLDPLIADEPDLVELNLRVEVRSNEYFPKSGMARFTPFEFRGKAHLVLARTLEGSESRKHLLRAMGDLKFSSAPNEKQGKNNRRSLAPLEQATRLMAERLRSALAHATWDPDDATLAPHAREFLTGWPEEEKAASDWLVQEAGRIADLATRLKKGTPKEAATKRQARRVVQWVDGVKESLGGQDGFKKALLSLEALRKDAQWVVDYRGTFTLAISVYPFARIEKLLLGDREIALDPRTTPVRIKHELEIADLTVILTHPGLKARKEFTCRATDLLDDQAYVISGTMEGDSLLNFGSLE